MSQGEGKGSRFAGILAAKRSPEPPSEQGPEQEPAAQVAADGAPTEQATPTALFKRGRPRGKRSDPDYEQVTAYIGRATHRDVKIALLQEGDGREFSELVEELLTEWLKSNI